MTIKTNGYQNSGAGLMAAGLAAAGTLASLYGGYQQQQSEQENYRDQMREFDRLKAIDEEERQRRIKEEALKQQMAVANFGDQNDQARMAQYAPYYRMAGR